MVATAVYLKPKRTRSKCYRRHFQMHFHGRKIVYFDLNLFLIGPSDQWFGSVLAPSRYLIQWWPNSLTPTQLSMTHNLLGYRLVYNVGVYYSPCLGVGGYSVGFGHSSPVESRWPTWLSAEVSVVPQSVYYTLCRLAGSQSVGALQYAGDSPSQLERYSRRCWTLQTRKCR